MKTAQLANQLAVDEENGMMMLKNIHKGGTVVDQLQVHVTSWSITLILFIITLILTRAGSPKAQKIFHMILRLFLVITLLTGIGLLVTYGFHGIYLIKGALGIILLIFLEMVVTKTRDREPVTIWWIVLIIDVILVAWIGFSHA